MSPTEMWQLYLKENHESEVIVHEHGFATYSIGRFLYIPEQDDKGPQIYQKELWVAPDQRGQHIASQLVDRVAEVGRLQGYSYMIGSTVIANGDSTISLLAALKYGFRLHSCQNGIIYFYKRI